MEDVTIIEKILRSITFEFDHVVCSIEGSKNIDIMLINELQSSLLMHDQHVPNHIEEEQDLKVIHIGNFYGRSI